MMQLRVDKIYYINLRKSVTRNNAAKDHFKQIGLVDKHGNPPVRFEALTAGDADFPIKGNFSQGEIGCFASHRAIWKDMVANKYLSVLVLEDDARFELYPELDFDTVDLVYMVYFGCYDHTNKKAIPDTISQESQFCFQVNNAWHTHAYVIGYPFLQKVLKATSEMRGSIDQHLVALQKHYPLHAIIPQVCHQAKPSISNPSTIKHTIQNVPLDISDLI